MSTLPEETAGLLDEFEKPDTEQVDLMKAANQKISQWMEQEFGRVGGTTTKDAKNSLRNGQSSHQQNLRK